jgi:GT2 family glycosyltransferase/glycosyltransferase involved in cell wall biosynthesis
VSVILFVSYSGLFGGAERMLLECAAGLPGEHVLACPEGSLADRARAAGMAVLTLPRRPLRLRGSAGRSVRAVTGLAGHAAEVRRLHRDLDAEVLIAWGMRSGLAARILPRSATWALEHHDFLPSGGVGRAVRAAAQHARVVLVPSQAVADDWSPPGRPADAADANATAAAAGVQVVPPGVDVEALADLGDPPSEPRVLVLGALAPWKRPDLALEICARAARCLPGLTVRLVGGAVTDDEPLVSALQARADAPDLREVAELSGPQADVRSELARAACLLHCAPREPFGVAIVEALAAGRPVVAPNSAGPREIIGGADCGELYEPEDAAAGAEALVRVLSSSEHGAELAQHARERARQFDVKRTRVGYAAALGPLVGGRPARPAVSPETLTLLTVSHNSAGELPRLAASVDRHLPGARLVVIDSGSSDESVRVARALGAEVVELGENVGFGRSCNRGLEAVQTPVTGLVNPDVELVDASLLSLAAEGLRKDRPERLLVPLVLNRDGSRQQTAHAGPGSLSEAVRAVVPPAALPGSLGVGLAPWRSHRPRRVGWAVGAALMARTETLRRLGPFDESIFMYAEDMELGLRAAQAGVPTWFHPEARVIHGGAHSSASAFGGEPFERLAAARRVAVERRLGASQAQRDEAIQALTFSSRLVLKRLLGRPTTRERRQLQALRRARRGNA